MFGLPLIWLKVGLGAAVVLAAVWVVDAIGDKREEIVNARWEIKMAKAREGQRLLRQRQRIQSEVIAEKNNSEWSLALAIAERERHELEDKIGNRVRVTCYPKDIIKAMNK